MEAQGLRGGPGALAKAGRALSGGRKPSGGRGAAQLAGSWCQVSHLSLQGAKCRESHCRGAAVRTHFAKVLRAAGGARQQGGGAGGGGVQTGDTAAVPTGHPDVLSGHPQDVKAWGGHGKQTWVSRDREGGPSPL